jgi:hypothetical protein
MASSNRRLVQRSRQSDAPTSGQLRHQARDRDAENQHELPSYETPACALSIDGRRALAELQNNYDYTKYEKHIRESMKVTTQTAAQCHDSVRERMTRLEKDAERRHRGGRTDDDMTEEERSDELFGSSLEKKAKKFESEAEKAMRDLVDYKDEVTMHTALIEKVLNGISSASPPVPSVRTRALGVNSDGGAEEGEEKYEDDGVPVDANGVSTVELLKAARTEYLADYQSKSMLRR